MSSSNSNSESGHVEKQLVFTLSNIIDTKRMNDISYMNSMHMDQVKPKDSKYIILKYKKDGLRNEVDLVKKNKIGFVRSVIYNTEKNCVVAASPCKSLDLSHMSSEDKSSMTLSSSLRVEEYVEGTMVNVFHEDSNDEWVRSTRSVLGAKTAFYNNTYNPSTDKKDVSVTFHNTSFDDMFMECVSASNFKLERLNKDYSYSFVIQHPANKIVNQINTPKLYLCAIYKCENQSVYEVPLYKYNDNRTNIEFNPLVKDMFRSSSVCIPYVDLHVKNIPDAILKYANSESTHFSIQGIVIKKDNKRFKITNPNYRYVRELRGNQSKIQYHFYELRRDNKQGEFLSFFPEYVNLFKSMEHEINLFAQTLFYMYHMCYRFKTKELTDFPYEYRNHIWELHRYYLEVLRPRRSGIQFKNVMKHLSLLEPARLMFSINFEKRQQHPDMSHMCGESLPPMIKQAVSKMSHS